MNLALRWEENTVGLQMHTFCITTFLFFFYFFFVFFLRTSKTISRKWAKKDKYGLMIGYPLKKLTQSCSVQSILGRTRITEIT